MNLQEAELYDQIRMAASRIGCRLFRNNVGVFSDPDKGGRFIRTGLCPGSSDMIGWRMVSVNGCSVAQFVAIEVKHPMRKRRLSESQASFLKIVLNQGGLAGVVSSPQEAVELLSSPVPNSTPPANSHDHDRTDQ